MVVNVRKNKGIGQKASNLSYDITDALLEYNKQGVKKTRFNFDSHYYKRMSQ
jgi:hypothetical protein